MTETIMEQWIRIRDKYEISKLVQGVNETQIEYRIKAINRLIEENS
jgi:hypothetical protein